MVIIVGGGTFLVPLMGYQVPFLKECKQVWEYNYYSGMYICFVSLGVQVFNLICLYNSVFMGKDQFIQIVPSEEGWEYFTNPGNVFRIFVWILIVFWFLNIVFKFGIIFEEIFEQLKQQQVIQQQQQQQQEKEQEQIVEINVENKIKKEKGSQELEVVQIYNQNQKQNENIKQNWIQNLNIEVSNSSDRYRIQQDSNLNINSDNLQDKSPLNNGCSFSFFGQNSQNRFIQDDQLEPKLESQQKLELQQQRQNNQTVNQVKVNKFESLNLQIIDSFNRQFLEQTHLDDNDDNSIYGTVQMSRYKFMPDQKN